MLLLLWKLAAEDSYSSSISEYKGKSFQYFMLPVSYSFLQVMGIPVVEGRNFSYETPLYWWIFVLAFLLVAAMTSSIVTYQSRRTANANPVDCIKSE